MFESKVILPFAGVMVGACVALYGSWYSNRSVLRREDRKQIIDRLEELFMLCQDLYDGHAAEIKKLGGFNGEDVETWLNARKHPGSSMARIRLIVKAYVPHMKAVLEELSLPHKRLKDTFLEIEASAKDPIALKELADLHANSLKEALSELGRATVSLKNGACDEISRRLEIDQIR